MRPQKLYDGAKERNVIVAPDEREAELFEVREKRVCRRVRRGRSCANTTRARKYVVRTKDGAGGGCGLVEGSMEGERDEVAREDDM